MGNKFIGWTAFAGQTNTTGTQVQIKVTYSDTTTTTTTATTAATASSQMGNAGGIITFVAGAASAVVAVSAKAVTKIEILTVGTGVGTRYGAISAIEVPQ